MGLLEYLFFFIVAAFWADIARQLQPDGIQGGVLAATIFGIAGAWFGASLNYGFVIDGVAVLPAILASAAFTFVYVVFSRLTRISGRI